MNHDLHCTEDELCAWLVDAELDESRQIHLESCADCQDRLRELGVTVDRLRTTQDEPATELWSRLHESFTGPDRRAGTPRIRLAPTIAMAAAILVLGFALGYRFAQHQNAVAFHDGGRFGDPAAEAPSLPFTSTAPLEISLPGMHLGGRGAVNDSL